MPNFHIEVHSRDRQIEHYICQNCKDEDEARDRILNFYVDRGLGILANFESMATHPGVPYYIFQVTQLEDEPVVYLTGEYRSKFPI